MCLYPKLIKNPKYKINKKNGGVIPPVSDERVLYVPIGCQKCIECKKQKANNWRTRMMEDIKTNKNGIFVTLTFSNENYIKYYDENKNLEGYALDNWIAIKAVRHFLERWRKKYGKSVRHWLVTELGHKGTENIHLHGIIWTDNKEDIEKIWKNGFVWIGEYVNDKTVNYIVKYITKLDKQHKHYEQIILTSSGIGSNYTNTYNSKLNIYKPEETKDTYTTRSGREKALPIYWRNKLYTDEEKEKLWIEKLNKNERWVMGVKITNEEEYKKALKYARIKNIKEGYGNDEKNWDEKQYEEQIRRIKQAERKNNNNKKYRDK